MSENNLAFCRDFSGLVVKTAFNMSREKSSDMKEFWRKLWVFDFSWSLSRDISTSWLQLFGMVVKNVFYVSKISFRGKWNNSKKHFFSKIFLILLEEISDLWQNFYCMVFETVFDMSSFFVETVYRFWLKNFRTFGKNIFPTVFQIEFDMYRGMFGRKFFCWQQIYREVFRILCVLSKKCRLCCVKTAFYVSRKTFKIVFLISSSVLFTPWLWTKLFRKVDKKPAKLGKTALYVSRRTKWGKTNWKNSFPQFFFQLLLKFFFKGVEIAFYLYSGYFSGKLFLDKKLFL